MKHYITINVHASQMQVFFAVLYMIYVQYPQFSNRFRKTSQTPWRNGTIILPDVVETKCLHKLWTNWSWRMKFLTGDLKHHIGTLMLTWLTCSTISHSRESKSFLVRKNMYAILTWGILFGCSLSRISNAAIEHIIITNPSG